MELDPDFKREFKADMTYILRLTRYIDIMYRDGKDETYAYLKRLRKIVDKFNEKYPKIHAIVRRGSLSIILGLMVRETEPEAVLDDRIRGKIFHKAKEMGSGTTHIYEHEIADTLALKKNVHRNMVEIIYREDTLNNEHSPEFLLLAEHAIEDYNPEIEVRVDKDDTFCFDFDPYIEDDDGMIYSPKKTRNEEIHY